MCWLIKNVFTQLPVSFLVYTEENKKNSLFEENSKIRFKKIIEKCIWGKNAG